MVKNGEGREGGREGGRVDLRASERPKKNHGGWTSHTQTDGHVDYMTDLAQRADSVKTDSLEVCFSILCQGQL